MNNIDKTYDNETIRNVRIAIQDNNIDYVKKNISEHEGLINEKTIFGTFLHDATIYKKYDIAKYLIENGIDINKKAGRRDSTALTYAAFKGSLDILELLFDNGAIIDVSTFERNPLFAAIPDGHFDVVKYLVEKGIDLSASYAIGDFDAIDAYEYARQYGRTEIANYLKEKMGK